MDRAAVSRASSHGVALTVDYDFRFPRDERGNSLGVVTRVKGCRVGLANGSDAVAAVDDLRKLQSPAPLDVIEAWLAELSVITARRGDDEFAEELRVTAYASRLRQFPADVVKQALLRKTWKFWPSWHELEAECRELSAPREAMISAILDAMARSDPAEHRERVSAERAAEIMREVWGAGA